MSTFFNMRVQAGQELAAHENSVWRALAPTPIAPGDPTPPGENGAAAVRPVESQPPSVSAADIGRRLPARERVLILGTSLLARSLIEAIETRPGAGYVVAGVAGDGLGTEGPSFPYPLLGPLRHLGKIIEEVRPDRIVVALAERRGQLPVCELLEARVCGGLVVEDGTDTYERLTGKLPIELLPPSSLLFSRDFRTSRWALVAERMLSLLASVIGLILLAPLIAAVAVAIRLDSRGPVFFVQERVGLRGKRFRLIKFRTMYPANGKTSEWVRDNHDRITRVGKWLRRFRLDELPQFVNILRGDMGLVGPRPHPVSNFELFLAKIPYYSLRTAVRPGLTGWAQVRYGYANNLEEETEKMQYDLYYIKHMSLWLDLRVVLETAKIVLMGHGSQTPRAAGAALVLSRPLDTRTEQRKAA
jgi:exopolysaccharide biosynthesis polyprenyl glycosylphosphotransferase